jgi:hypothetical protein
MWGRPCRVSGCGASRILRSSALMDFSCLSRSVPPSVVCRCWLRSQALGSGSWAFAASSSTLPVAGRVLEVFPFAPGRPPLRGGVTASSGLPLLQSSRSVPDPRVLLSWDSSASPLYRHRFERPLPDWRCRLPFGRSLPEDPSCSVSAVSHRPDGLLRSYFAGLLRPAAGSRFIAFQPLVLRTRRPGRVRSSPRCVFPSKDSPRR